MKFSTLETVFASLNTAQVRYLVAGGVAVNIHGYQRMTADLDLVIQLDSGNIKKAMVALDQLGYVPIIPVTIDDFADPEQRKQWVDSKNMQVLSLHSTLHPETTIDIFVSEPFEFDNEYDTAVEAVISPDTVVNVVNIPALIAMKNKAGRARDLDDIQHLKLIAEQNQDD